MSATIDWEQLPEQEYESYKERMRIVELLLDADIVQRAMPVVRDT